MFRDFLSSRISNDDFEYGRGAIHAIRDRAWVLYNDTHEHKLVGRHRLSADQRRICVRWLIFLHGDCDYVWPDTPSPGIDPSARTEAEFWQRLCWTNTLVRPEMAVDFLSAGHFPVWPFALVADYCQALRHPKLFSGQ